MTTKPIQAKASLVIDSIIGLNSVTKDLRTKIISNRPQLLYTKAVPSHKKKQKIEQTTKAIWSSHLVRPDISIMAFDFK